MITVSIIVFFLALYKGLCVEDPCKSYNQSNDTAFTIAYTANSADKVTCQSYVPLKWYRFTGTTHGLMINSCPKKLQCGSPNHIWFNDSIPLLSDGEIDKTICVHDSAAADCCSLTNTITAKNCTTFIVYKSIPTASLPNCTNYCYAAPGGGSTPASGSLSVVLLMLPFILFTSLCSHPYL